LRGFRGYFFRGDNVRGRILKLLENDARLSFKDMAVMLGTGEEDVAREVARMIDGRVICGFVTLVNWDKTAREVVTALIEVKVTPIRGQGFDKIAERIYKFDEVSAVYLMSGGFDLTVILEGKTMKDVAFFVYEKLAPLEGVIGTATHFVLKKYKEHNIVLDKPAEEDARMKVSP
jgi:DNA-binding Lrp family transcriptional regulator